MNIDERVQTLEKQNETFAGQIKNLKKMLGGVAALALASLIGGTVLGVHAHRSDKDDIRAKDIYLYNSSGKLRVMLKGSSGSLTLYDSKGKHTVMLTGTNGRIGRKKEYKIR